MVKEKLTYFLGILLLFSCSDANTDELIPVPIESRYYNLTDSLKVVGARNAVKKAYQLTDILYTPKATIGATSFKSGKEYKGMIYSSVKEINTYVGLDVSFHTFMTAVNNQRSLLYTEVLNKPPYHGANCSAYYGTVCSALVSYALGLKYQLGSNQFEYSDLFELVDNPAHENVQIADVIWQPGHVAIVTGINCDNDGMVKNIEYCEAVSPRCHRVKISPQELTSDISLNGKKLFRYKYLEKNIEYMPATGFVDVEDEKSQPFIYNDLICTNKGDKACFREGENVIINLSGSYEFMELYKDDVLVDVLNVREVNDTTLASLPYGDYKARLFKGSTYSDFTYWKVINVDVSIDKANNTVYFQSQNSIPESYEFCTISGSRGIPQTYVHELTDEEVRNGFSVIPSNKINSSATYIKVHFKCDYGRVINQPIVWK